MGINRKTLKIQVLAYINHLLNVTIMNASKKDTRLMIYVKAERDGYID